MVFASLNRGQRTQSLMNKRILLADSDASVRETLGRVLELEHYEVALAGSGREAVAKDPCFAGLAGCAAKLHGRHMLIAVTPWDMHQFDCQVRQAGYLPASPPQRKSREPSRKGTGMAIPRNDRAPFRSRTRPESHHRLQRTPDGPMRRVELG